MERIISILFILIVLISCDNSKTNNSNNSALKQTTNYDKTDNFYYSALKRAAKHDKIVILDFTAIWCSGCKAYDNFVFDDSIMQGELNKKFILLKIDIEKRENKFLVNKYKTHRLPHIIFIDKNEKNLGSIIGFKNEFRQNPEEFLVKIENILDLQPDISKLEYEYQSDSTNLEGINKLLKLYKKAGRYIEQEKLSRKLVELEPNPEKILEYQFKDSMNLIYTKNDPLPLLKLINSNQRLTKQHIRKANSKLLEYYISIDNVEKQDYYYKKNIGYIPDYFTKLYIRFLFEHNYKIDTAILLTNETLAKYPNLINDYWGQFLKAHSLVFQGQRDKAVKGYYNWMIKNKSIWESNSNHWPLYFYARFANYHSLDLENALEFIKIAKSDKLTQMIDIKSTMSETLYKLGKITASIDLLYEIQNQTKDKNEYDRVEKLIDKYKNEIKSTN